jgi:hypothetical protein
MLTDYEAVVRDLRIHLEKKDSHGRRELHTVIGELEARHAILEGVTERALRIAGAKLSEQLIKDGQNPYDDDSAGVVVNGSEATLS